MPGVLPLANLEFIQAFLFLLKQSRIMLYLKQTVDNRGKC